MRLVERSRLQSLFFSCELIVACPFSLSLSLSLSFYLSSAYIQGTAALFSNAPAARAAKGLPFSLEEEAICVQFFLLAVDRGD